MQPPVQDPRTLSARASKVVLAAVLVTAVSGYFMGLHPMNPVASASRLPPGVGSAESAAVAETSGVPRVVEYRLLGETPWKPNATWHSRLEQLRPAAAAQVGPTSTSPARLPASDLQRGYAVGQRAERRAFEGAPPVIPHPVDPLAPDNCRACHLAGLAVRGVVARRMSHGELGSCIQCHVPSQGPGPIPREGELPAFADTTFVGLGSAGRGARAWPGAPPTIPHTLWMRQECGSCHGVGGLEGLRTSHPERVLCLQCHVPDGSADRPPWLSPDLASLAEGIGGGESR